MSLELLQRVNSSVTPQHIDGFALPWTPARLRSHPTIGLLMQGKSPKRVSGQGFKLQWKFDGKVETDFAPSTMGADYTWNATGEMNFLGAPWREARWSESIFAHEMSFGGQQAYGPGHALGLWDILQKKNLNFALGPIDKIESVDLWRTPSAVMQAQSLSALPIYSIPCFLNQWVQEMGTVGDGVPPGFTSQLEQLPANYPDPHRVRKNYIFPFATQPQSMLACQQIGYADGASGVTGSGNTTVSVGHLIERLAYAIRATGYETVPMVNRTEAGEMSPLRRAILCSDAGVTYMQQTQRANGEKLNIVNEMGVVQPLFGNIPLQAVPALNNRALYPDTTGGNDVPGAAARPMVDEFSSAGFTGPRYYLPDSAAMDLTFHNDGYWNVMDWRFLDQINRDRLVKDGRIWWQLMVRQFVTSAILFPTANQSRFGNY